MLDAQGVPNAPLLTVDQVAAHPQTEALDMTVRCEEAGIDLVGIPLAFDGERPAQPGERAEARGRTMLRW